MTQVRQEVRWTMAGRQAFPVPCAEPGCSTLVLWAEQSGRRRPEGRADGGLRFAFYGRVSTEDWQDPESSLARQLSQAEALVRGHGRIVARFSDIGESRSVAWGRRPQAALIAQLADPGRDQGRYLGGRPPYGYRLADAGPHPNKAHAAWVGVLTAWSRTRRQRLSCGGCSPSALPGTARRGSRGR